ncbi:MAG TPA: DUF2934 domain-containing protein [Vicinamibacterales bacterium]|nr:DUF2934 domain-containing protein [Vicinamibacterales bacterium]
MAKKAMTRSKMESRPDAPVEPEPAAPAKPRARAKAAPKRSDTVVAGTAADATGMSAVAEPTEDEIRLRAYHRYLERGGGHGMDFEDWLEAKRELRELNDRK